MTFRPTARWFAPGFLLLALVVFVPAAEPPNLWPAKQAIRAYLDSGEYDRDIAAVTAQASSWLDQRVREESVRPAAQRTRLAAVFDIDETLLCNLPHMRKMDFGYVKAEWDAWVDSGQAPPIGPVRDLLLHARQLGVAVFILSGRAEADRAGTEKNLRAVGAADVAGLWFKPADPAQTTETFKTRCRGKIEADGYTIVLNIGDQDSDLAGGHAERTFKLPDPFYIIK